GRTARAERNGESSCAWTRRWRAVDRARIARPGGRVIERYQHSPRRRNGPARRRLRSTGHNQIDGLRPLALLVGLHIELDVLPFVQALETGLLDCGDVNEHIASAIVGLDESVAPLPVEELDRTGHCHRETPSPNIASPPAPTDGGSVGHSAIGESVGPQRPKTIRRSPQRRRNVTASAIGYPQCCPAGKSETASNRGFCGQPFDGGGAGTAGAE